MAAPTVIMISPGHRIDYTPGADVAAGDVVLLGQLPAVATEPLPANKLGSLAVEGVAKVPKTASGGIVFAAGDRVYWDSGNKKGVAAQSTFKLLGTAVLAAADGDSFVYVKLIGFAGMQFPVVSIATGLKVVAGEVTLDGANPTPVVTGLATVTAAVVMQKSASTPGDDPSGFTVDYGGGVTAGTLNVYAWKNTGGTDPTLVASTNNTAVVSWIAFGT